MSDQIPENPIKPGKIVQIVVAEGRYAPNLYALDENGVIWRQDIERSNWYPIPVFHGDGG